MQVHEQRLAAHQQEIAYSKLFTELFDRTVVVTYGRMHPREALEYLADHPDTMEEQLYRPYLQGLWQANTSHWGETEF